MGEMNLNRTSELESALEDAIAYLEARRVRIVVVPIELNNERVAMKDFSGSIRTSIQRQNGGQVVAA